MKLADSDDARRLVAQYLARKSGGRKRLTAHHFDEQAGFWQSEAQLSAALCSRRAGKTRGGNEEWVEEASRTPHGRFLYVNETRGEAKRLAWIGARGDGMKPLAESLGVGAICNEAELTIHFPEVSAWVYLVGVDDERAIMKALGLPYHGVWWDEAQKIPSKFTPTILETLLPTLLDYGGKLKFTGTADRKMSGLFYDITRPELEKRTKGWEVHGWTLMQNPYWGRAKRIKGQWFVVWRYDDKMHSGPHAEADIAEAVRQCRFTQGVLGLQKLLGGAEVAPLDSPIMRRQAGNEWVREDSNFVYWVHKVPEWKLTYAPARYREDGFIDVPAALADLPYRWQEGFFALGVDLGYNDPFAMTMWSWHQHDPRLYEVFSWKRSELTSDQQNLYINDVRQHVTIGVIDADAGGIGKQVVKGWSSEWVNRYGLPIFEAEKQHKLTAIQTYNNDIVNGMIQYREGGMLLEEQKELQYATIVDGSGRMVEDPTMANDVSDSSLYPHRRTWQYRHSAADKLPPRGSRERYEREARELEEELT